ncbi:hypothetical protein ACFYOY_13035 [Streptomyces sp. NPDC007875]|uniref:hypothetical protein n=1 Tax=Streptomyces sp. NPDC007875 TaxID=3364783 RepID=UPI0036A013A7
MNDTVIEMLREDRVNVPGRDLTVETVSLEGGEYGTRVVDNTGDQRHSNMTVGGWVINGMYAPTGNWMAAMNCRRDAVCAATYKQIEPRRTR